MRAMAAYVRIVDAVNYRIGRIVMFGLFVMMAILLWSSISKTFFVPSLWTLEIAQFAMMAYFILGGPYSIQLGSNVRMDLFYHRWSTARKAAFDIVTALFLIFYLAVLLYGGVSSTAYALGYWGTEPFAFFGDIVAGFVAGGPDGAGEVIGRLEQSPSAWRPYLWPIKLVMVAGVVLMLLQVVSEIFKDIARLRGVELGGGA